MKRNRFSSLRFKLTAIVLGVMAVGCVLLTSVALSSSQQIVDAVPMQPIDIAEDLPEQPAVGSAALTTPAAAAELVSTAQGSFRIQNLIAMTVVILAGSWAAYWLVRRQLRPLEALAAAVDRMDADSLEPEAIAVPRTGDETEQLSQAISDMTRRVGDAYRAQKEFAASAAHELRTPLAAIQSRIEVFRMKRRTAQEYEALLAQVQGNVARLSELTEQLFLLSAPQRPDEFQAVSLDELASGAAAELRPAAAARGISFDLRGEAIMEGNRCLLYRALFNLMENAVKYGAENSVVHVELNTWERRVQICVSDTGPGLSDTEKARIFEAFYRVDKSRSLQMGGNGLGLAVVRRIARQHGGDVRVEDAVPHGCRFILEFPVLRKS